MKRINMSEEERRWRARDDARTLAAAESIRSDSERLKAASQAANEMLAEEAERLKGLSHVATSKRGKDAVQNARRVSSKKRSTMVAPTLDLPDCFKIR